MVWTSYKNKWIICKFVQITYLSQRLHIEPYSCPVSVQLCAQKFPNFFLFHCAGWWKPKDFLCIVLRNRGILQSFVTIWKSKSYWKRPSKTLIFWWPKNANGLTFHCELSKQLRIASKFLAFGRLESDRGRGSQRRISIIQLMVSHRSRHFMSVSTKRRACHVHGKATKILNAYFDIPVVCLFIYVEKINLSSKNHSKIKNSRLYNWCLGLRRTLRSGLFKILKLTWWGRLSGQNHTGELLVFFTFGPAAAAKSPTHLATATRALHTPNS